MVLSCRLLEYQQSFANGREGPQNHSQQRDRYVRRKHEQLSSLLIRNSAELQTLRGRSGFFPFPPAMLPLLLSMEDVLPRRGQNVSACHVSNACQLVSLQLIRRFGMALSCRLLEYQQEVASAFQRPQSLLPCRCFPFPRLARAFSTTGRCPFACTSVRPFLSWSTN